MPKGARQALAGLAMATAGATGAPPVVDWYVADFPPSSIQTGPQAGTGYLDRALTEVLVPGLPGFRHRVVSAPPARLHRDLLDKPLVCSPAMNKTDERERTLYLSVPVFRFLPVGLLVKRDALVGLQAWSGREGRLNLAAYVQARHPQIGAVARRAHGAAVDTVMAQAPEAFVRLSTTQASASMMRMLMVGHALDGVLGYAFEIAPFEQLHPAWEGQLAWVPLEGLPSHQFAHVACSRSPLGRQVVDAVNTLLTQGQGQARIQALFELWLDAQGRQTLDRQRQALRRPDDFWTE